MSIKFGTQKHIQYFDAKKNFFLANPFIGRKKPFWKSKYPFFIHYVLTHFATANMAGKKFLWKPNSPIACNIESIFYFSKKGLIGCKCTFLWNFDHFFAFFGTFYSDTFCHAKYGRKKIPLRAKYSKHLSYWKCFSFFKKRVNRV